MSVDKLVVEIGVECRYYTLSTVTMIAFLSTDGITQGDSITMFGLGAFGVKNKADILFRESTPDRLP